MLIVESPTLSFCRIPSVTRLGVVCCPRLVYPASSCKPTGDAASTFWDLLDFVMSLQNRIVRKLLQGSLFEDYKIDLHTTQFVTYLHVLRSWDPPWFSHLGCLPLSPSLRVFVLARMCLRPCSVFAQALWVSFVDWSCDCLTTVRWQCHIGHSTSPALPTIPQALQQGTAEYLSICFDSGCAHELAWQVQLLSQEATSSHFAEMCPLSSGKFSSICRKNSAMFFVCHWDDNAGDCVTIFCDWFGINNIHPACEHFWPASSCNVPMGFNSKLLRTTYTEMEN